MTNKPTENQIRKWREEEIIHNIIKSHDQIDTDKLAELSGFDEFKTTTICARLIRKGVIK